MRTSAYASFKPEILKLRQQGLSYSQIREKIGVKIPQGTLSNWCSRISLSPEAQAVLRKRMSGDPYRIAIVKLLAKVRREKRRVQVQEKHSHLLDWLDNLDVAKIALTMLYLGEGRKDERGVMTFGNSNPEIVRLFMTLFTQVYETELSKFRITVQCRADQNVRKLERFWRKVIGIPGIRLYKTRIDERTRGKPTKRKDYMGVCCISYHDTKIQFELVSLGFLLCQCRQGR